ncbi:MAG: hypothetical protein ACOYJS_05730 [Acutalibacteraceae bacterium]|jgi:hypothetical protein
MKKYFSVILSVLMILSLISLAGCGKDGKDTASGETLKLGLGVHSYIEEIKNADGDNNGEAESVTTAAAVLLDKTGKIVKCALDTAVNKIAFTAAGQAVEPGKMLTKYELKNDYGMKSKSAVKKEWFEQVDAFISVVEGKTLEEVKALMAEDKKGKEAVVNAGCTIVISDFINAIEKAVDNAVDSNAKTGDIVKLGFVSSLHDKKDATEDAKGLNQVDTTIVATALNKDNKVTASVVDAVQTKVEFDNKGVSNTSYGFVIATKKALGDKYGMAASGKDLNGDGVVKEWYEQATAFSKACEGKKADDIAKLVDKNGYGVESIQKAGCTINIDDMVKAAIKAATVEK